MPVAFPIEALLMSAESRHPAFNLCANGACSNTGLGGVSMAATDNSELFKFDDGGSNHGGRGSDSTRPSTSGFLPVTDCTNAIVCTIKRSRSAAHFITTSTQ